METDLDATLNDYLRTLNADLALASPLFAGALRDALGSFTLAFVPTLGLGLVMLALVLILPETGRGIRGA